MPLWGCRVERTWERKAWGCTIERQRVSETAASGQAPPAKGAGGRRHEREFNVAPVASGEAIAAKIRVIGSTASWREPQTTLQKPTEDDDAALRCKRKCGDARRPTSR